MPGGGPPARSENVMKALSLAVALFGLLALVQPALQANPGDALLGVVALICAYTTYRAAAISSFLQILVGIFSTETILSGLAVLAGRAGADRRILSAARLAAADGRDLHHPGLRRRTLVRRAADHAHRRPLFRDR